MDTVFITGLKIDTVIGVFDWEKEIRQTLVIDLKMANDNRIPAANDEIDKALDYAKVSEAISEFANAHQFELIETFAERLSGVLMNDFGICWLELTVNKPGAVPNAQTVGVQIARGQRN